MRTILILFTFLVGTTCKPSTPSHIDVPDSQLAIIGVEPLEDGFWDVHMTFSEPQTALIFSRSIGDYRTSTWKSLDENVRIERLDGFDTILFNDPGTDAHFRVKPYSETLRGDYEPALEFSNGAVAIYLGQFELLEVADKDTALALEGELSNWNGEQKPITIKMVSQSPILNQGEWVASPLTLTYPDDEGYVFLGEGDITQGRDFSGVIDEGLPDWLRQDFDAELNATFNTLRESFGSDLSQKASILFSFGGYEGRGYSNSGGALPGPALVLTSSGDALKEFDEGTLGGIRWFFAHEGAHLFQSRVHKSYPIQSWLHEGHASAIGYDVLEKRGVMTEQTARRRARQDEICLSQLEKETDKGAGNVSKHYECGALLWTLIAALTPEQDLYSIWDLAVARVAKEGGRLAQDRLFSLLRELDTDSNTMTKLETFTYGPVENPRAHYKDLRELAGLKITGTEAR